MKVQKWFAKVVPDRPRHLPPFSLSHPSFDWPFPNSDSWIKSALWVSSMDTIHRGFLIKEGGHGHQYKNEKKRWFVLKDMFLFYYSGVPAPTKNMLKLKGVIYLAGCRTKDNPKNVADTFVLESWKKEYVLSSVSQNPTADILSWRNSMEYAIEQSVAMEKEGGSGLEVVSGWLTKKGAKGHTYQNWKKRWFILRGNILFYFEEKDDEMETRGWANLEKMKGFIETSMITDIDADVSSDGNGFQFIVTVNNDKSYIFASKSLDEKNNWISALRRRIERFSKNAMQVSLNTCSQEVFVKSGELKRHLSVKRSKTNYFILTNVNMRVYASKPDDLANIGENWGKGMIACIPLLGCSIQSSDDSDEWDLKQNEMAIIEIQGHAYVLETSSVQERIDWVLAMKTSSRNLAKMVVGSGETIRLTCNASDKNDHNAGYTILTIDKAKLQLRYLMLKKIVEIPFSKLKLVFLQPGFLFCLKYSQNDKAKQLKMKCGNASGIFDAVEAIFELIQQNSPVSDRLTSRTSLMKNGVGNGNGNGNGGIGNGNGSSNGVVGGGIGSSSSYPHLSSSSPSSHPPPSSSSSSTRAIAHPSLSDPQVLAEIESSRPSSSKPPRRLTKEMILTSRQSEDIAITHAIASSSSSSSLSSSSSSRHHNHHPPTNFSDFHYDAAPSPSMKKSSKKKTPKKKSSSLLNNNSSNSSNSNIEPMMSATNSHPEISSQSHDGVSLHSQSPNQRQESSQSSHHHQESQSHQHHTTPVSEPSPGNNIIIPPPSQSSPSSISPRPNFANLPPPPPTPITSSFQSAYSSSEESD